MTARNMRYYKVSLIILGFVLGMQNCKTNRNRETTQEQLSKEKTVEISYNGCGLISDFLLYREITNKPYYLLIYGNISNLKEDTCYKVRSVDEKKIAVSLDYYPNGIWAVDYCSDILITNNIKKKIETLFFECTVERSKVGDVDYVSINLERAKFYNSYLNDTISYHDIFFQNVMLDR